MRGLHKGSAAGQSHWPYGDVLNVCLWVRVSWRGRAKRLSAVFCRELELLLLRQNPSIPSKLNV